MTERIPLAAAALICVCMPAIAQPLPTPRQMADAREDVWGEAAVRQPGGPSYEYFKDLLPPLRYVNTAFRHYPIALSAPCGALKARWVSNGSGVNLRADKPPMWREVGTPVAFHVGETSEAFGADVKRLDGPRYADGYLPVVQVTYSADGTRYEQEAFAPTSAKLANHGAVCVRFTVRNGPGRVTVRAADGSPSVAQFGSGWTSDEGKAEWVAELKPNLSAELVVFTKPTRSQPKTFPFYDAERKACVETWNVLLARGARFDVPEPIVQNAWRSLVIGNHLIAAGDRMNYSAGNAYDHLYEGECGDAVRALMLFGHTTDARRMIGPLLAFDRKATRFHVAGHKLQLLAHYYWVTRDKDYLAEKRPVWEPVIEFVRKSRQSVNGLLPKDRYAGDIAETVYSLSSNAACWRGLRDMAAVLEDTGERDKAAELRREAAAFRKVILDAVARSERRDVTPPFIPIKLLDDEPPHDPLTATRTGSYYDLMIPYVLGSGVLDAEREGWVIDYLRKHGGLAMGMIRSMPHQGQFKGEPGVNVLYGLRYVQTILRRGDRDLALAGFYGQLAQGMTRDTFVGGEGSRFFHGDEHGRSFYLPPNSASNAMFLTTLRGLLIQDWDQDDDGKPETLRLLDAIPPRWLKDGAVIMVEKAPTAFGEVSFRVESRLKMGEVIVRLEAPARPVGRWHLRLPSPPGYHVTSVKVGNVDVNRDAEERIDLTGRKGAFTVRYTVEASRDKP